MAEKQTIVINDIEYAEDQLTDQQKLLINHIADLDRNVTAVMSTRNSSNSASGLSASEGTARTIIRDC